MRGQLDVHNEIDRKELIIEHKIGDGTAGSVWKGKWRSIDIAIKYFPSRKDANSVDPTEFRRELSLLS